MASRRKGRILAFQALFCWESARTTARESGHPLPTDALERLLEFSWLGEKARTLDESIAAFARLLIAGTAENVAVIDKTIKAHLLNWDISRLNRVDLAIMRMSVYTLMFQKDLAPSIVIDEAIGISREFGTDDSFKFINGVLDGIRKTLEKESG
ncbi:MAG: transcription antitermination factor NusB [Treponema sp.]|nr:transcription antitermination factor NusB [Treponema sp.]